MNSFNKNLNIFIILIICCQFITFQVTNAEYSDSMQVERQRYTNSYQQQRQYATEPENRYEYQEKIFERRGGGGRRQNQQRGRLSQLNTRGNPTQPNISISDPNKHKCQIWIPSETFTKYPDAISIQTDQSNQLQLIEICCEGYKAYIFKGRTQCQPVCENCLNGNCVEPDECQCFEGFVKNDNGDCIFTCPLGCDNGRCYLDGSCQCDPGYKLDRTRKYCRPICTGGCGLNKRHNCTEPEVCGCSKGYQLTDEGCQPTCQPECGIGGKCIEYNKCECDVGYNLKDGVCQSDCYQKCDNGICYSRNRCICNSGYSYHERSTQCVPKE